ncbi:hypothetical protein SSX86_012481 [Deinandra increscens subsp. villosa]|uniref:Two-component response regulator n=1 Tax=Deinandra increscens subsp. villosa TaxID=3103831 RepID=A0AAP0GYU2_9ASTR
MNPGGRQVVNKQMMPSSSGGSWKSSTAGGGGGDGGVHDQFPAGLRVLVVDDDSTCLMILEKMLRHCNYEVTKCNRAEVALSFLRENKSGFDVVISDVHMPDMDGFKLLEHIGLEMDLPVIMMSADDSKSVVMKGVTHGACDYLIKPVRIEALRNIWQHVVRKRKHEWKEFEPSASTDEHKPPEEPDYSSSANEGHNWKNTKRRKDEEDEAEERDDSSSLKKPRVVWSVELHQQFVAAVNQLGIDKAVPKKILELMNVPGLSRENVASHLQKYRLYLRRLSGPQHPGGMDTGFMSGQDAGYGPMSSLNGLDLQALAAGGQLGQLPPQSLATLQAVALGRSNNLKSAISVPAVDQRNIFSFENPKSRYSEAQSQHLSSTSSSSSKQINLLPGIPTNMEPKQFVSLHQSGQHCFGSINNQVRIQMGGQGPSQSQNQVQSNTNVYHGLRQPVLSNDMATRVYNPVVSVSQASSLLDSSRSSYSVGGSMGIPNVRATSSALQGDGNLDTKVSVRGIVPSYDVFNDLNQNRNWSLQDVGLTFDQSPHSIHVGPDVPSPSLLQHNRSSGCDMRGENRSLTSGKNMSSTIAKFAHLQIPLEDVVKATNSFHHDNIIGQGDFGRAYKGRLLRSGRLMNIAARRFDCKHGDGDLMFLREISVLSDLSHPNLLSIIGFCDEKDEKIVVTTYEATGSLGKYLNSPDLTWTQILRISVSVARALSYLHYDEGRDYAIIHCNINSDTILLDEKNWEVKLSGFEHSVKQLECYKDENLPSTIAKYAHLQIPLEDVVKGTNNFHHDNIIGQGDFGTAYKGRLLWSGRLMNIAARRFDCKHREGDLKFLREISLLSDLSHPNLISIIGFCDEKDEKIVITAYEANESIRQYLNSPNLTWTQLLRICVSAARALSYLHYEAGRDYVIIHCNINTDTILLDEKNWEAKLSGFEHFIKQLECYKDEVCLYEYNGTMGCMDPSIEKTRGVTHKSDIYSFGVVLFEILCGRNKASVQSDATDRLAGDPVYKKESDRGLAVVARQSFCSGTLEEMIDPLIKEETSENNFVLNRGPNKDSLNTFIDIAIQCVAEAQDQRPSMKVVVKELEKALLFQISKGEEGASTSREISM